MTTWKKNSGKCKKKSFDLNPIPTRILHDCLEEITPIVSGIINNSVSCGVAPQCFKHALVKPLLKRANLDPNCSRNYRPVSNLSFFVKGAGAHCVKTVFAAPWNLTVFWSPSSQLTENATARKPPCCAWWMASLRPLTVVMYLFCHCLICLQLLTPQITTS